MKKTITLIAAAVFVLGGATMVLAQSDDAETTTHRPGKVAELFHEVLDDLVADGTLNQDQAEAIVAAVAAKRDEIRSEREEIRDQMRGFWSDGVLTRDEIDQLPEGHPWRRIAEMFDGDEITREDLRELRPFRWRFGPHGQDS